MDRSIIFLFILGVSLPVAMHPSHAQPTQIAQATGASAPPIVVVADVKNIQAKVEEIDYATRMVSLKKDNGEVSEVKVPESVVNFPQIKKGDTINLKYQDATAFTLLKAEDASAGETPSIRAYSTAQVAPPGEKPGAVATQVFEVTTTVVKIDAGARQVTLRGPLGHEQTIDVDKRVENLDRIKPGDRVFVRHTEAVAAEVTK